MHIYNWDQWAQKTVPVPMVTGHEFVGAVADIGAAVTEYKVGERVSGEGPHRLRPLPQLPRGQGASLPQHARRRRQPAGRVRRISSAIPQHNVVPIPDDIPDEIAAIFDPLGNAVHTALSFDLVGEDVLVTGAGPIGIMGALVAQVRRRAQGRDHRHQPGAAGAGAASSASHHVVDASKEKLRDVMTRDRHEGGLRRRARNVGRRAAFRDMIDTMNNGGKIAILGIAPTGFEIDWNKVIFKMLTLKGIYGREMFETWYKMIALVQGAARRRRA